MKTARLCRFASACVVFTLTAFSGITSSLAQAFLDNQTQYTNQDSNIETRRSDHFRMVFGHYNTDPGLGGMTEAMAQGNLQEYEQMWHRWVIEMGLHDNNESSNPTYQDGNKYRANFNFLKTFNDGGGGGAYTSSDAKGFFYSMANPAYCRWDPPSGTTPHEFGHTWEGTCAGFNNSDSSGPWWEGTANWMLLQFLNTYPQAGGYLQNGMYYPAHGRDYYDSWVIYEAAKDDPRYGAAWVNNIWTNFNAFQQTNEFILDRMIRCDSSGSPDNAGGMKDLWGDMAKKMVTWDFQRQPWLAQVNFDETNSNPRTAWNWYQRCRTPMVVMPGTNGWYRPAREHLPQQFGFNFIPLSASPNSTVSCNFQPQCDPVRQSDWRACLVAVDTNGGASYSALWNKGVNSLTLSADQTKLYLVVIATPKPMKIPNPTWAAYTTNAGAQFPYALSFSNAAPRNVVFNKPTGVTWKSFTNADGTVCPNIASGATVSSTAYISPNATVLDTATVSGYARLEDYAVVCGSAQVRDYAVISGHGEVQDNAQVYGHAKVRDWARVFGYAQVYENGKVIEHANVGDGNATSYTQVYGYAVVKGTSYVDAPSTFNGCIIVEGDTNNGNGTTPSSYGVAFGWSWGENPSIFAGLTNNNYIYAQHTFERDNPVFAMDQYGINHGFLMNGCRATNDTGSSLRGGLVLPLNGSNQYVELHNSLNDFKDTTIAVWLKWAGNAADQRVWSMGDGASKQMYLTPEDGTTGGLRFVISDGTTTQTLEGGTVPANTWTHVAVVFSSAAANCVLYVNGAAVATNSSISLYPDSLNAPLMANANYLGRGNTNNYFQGSVDDFTVYMTNLTSAQVLALYNTAAPAPFTPVADTTAPTPNAATWLVTPKALSDSVITMSATPGTDASGWVEYNFTCTAGGGHSSGWVSFNKYTDCGLNPGTTYSYTVQMRDKNGNTTAASSVGNATTLVSSIGAASFAYGPVGITNGQITMTATALTNASGKTEYNFSSTSGKSSGWQASRTWTETGLSTGASYTYTVTARDGRGHTSAASAGVAARAQDDAAPLLPITPAHWVMEPYPTISNTICMTAQGASDLSGVQYYFHCTSSNAPDSGWQDSATYTTPALADGAYSFQYKLRDKSPQSNQSGYSTTFTGTITPTTGYHPCTFSQLTTLPDDDLVTFSGQIIGVNPTSYAIQDTNSAAVITVWPDTYAEATDLMEAFKIVSVSGHLYTYTNSGGRVVSFAHVTTIGNPPYTISGTVTDSVTGALLSGMNVYASVTPNASTNPAAMGITDNNGQYTLPITNGTWYICVVSSNYITSADQRVTVNGTSLNNVNFSMVPKPRVYGRVTDLAGSPISGATVWFSLSPDAPVNTFRSTTTDAAGNYVEVLDRNTYYVAAGASNYLVSTEVSVPVTNDVTGFDFALASPAGRNVPQSSQLIFSCITDYLPISGKLSTWPTYLPSGQNLSVIYGSPVAQVEEGKLWESQTATNKDGWRLGYYTSPIPCNGASIVMVVKPKRNGIAQSWITCLDVFYDRLVIGVRNDTGVVNLARNGSWANTPTAIPDGQVTVLSMVVQSNGQYNVWANGVPIYTNTTLSPMVALTNGVAGGYANAINLGRDDSDGWPSFNGGTGDTYLYKVALSTTERQQLENDLMTRFGSNTTHAITASANTGGSISPDGTVNVLAGANQSFTLTTNAHYYITNLVVDGISKGALSSYTFTNVTANHTISAVFAPFTHTITASAGSNGSISPSGAVAVPEATDQTFTFTPNSGYMVDVLTVDGVSVGRMNSYTFTNVLVNHTISVTFKTLVQYTITASADTNGTISPSGAVSVLEGYSQTFTTTPNANYVLSSLLVDGVSVGTPSSYTFTNVVANHTIVAGFSPYTGPTPVAWYQFENNVLDTMGNYNGTAYTNPTYVPGKLGAYAIQFNGSNQYATITRSVSNDWTIAFWVKTTQTSLNGTGGWYQGSGLVDGECSGVQNDFGISYLNSKVAFGVGNPDTTFYSVSTINSGNWVHVACTRSSSSGQMQIYINGVLETTGTGPTGTRAAPALLHLGNIQTGINFFNGALDQLRIYNTVLSATDISYLYNEPAYDTITATAGANGSISPSGTVMLKSGANQTFSFTPSANYFVTNVVVDGVSVGNPTTYTFTNVRTNHTITAAFGPLTAPTAWYQFETNVLDSAGSNDGTAYNSPSYIPGKLGAYAIQFNGTNQYVSIPRAISNDWTIAFWVKTTQTSLTGGSWWSGNGLVDGEVPGATNDFGVSFLNNKVAFGVGNPDTTIQSVSTINSGNWTHVAVSRSSSSGQMKVYINGNLETTGTGPTGTRATPSTLHLGNLQSGLNYFNGALDQVRIYGSVLSAGEISGLAGELNSSYTITASAGANGSISPSGSVVVSARGTQSFTITPNANYALSDVLVDGVSLGAVTSYTFSNVTAGHTISASFMASGPPPLAWYQFETNVLDSAGSYDGTAYNNPTYIAGKIGSYAIQFNGTNQYATIPRSISNDFTIAFWVMTTQTSRTGSQWYNGNGLVDGEVAGVANDFGVSFLNNKVAFGVGNPDTTFQSTNTINSGNWTHVAVTRNSTNGQMQIYLNGVLETTGTGPTGTRNAPPTLHLGDLQTGLYFFNGAIDQLKIYNTVLSASDISVLASESSGAAPMLALSSLAPAGGQSTSSSPASTTPVAPLPSPWLNQDLGDVGAAGSASYGEGTYTLAGAGAAIGGTADACQFVYQPSSGDCTNIVRVATIQNTGKGARAGVMMRDNLNANAMAAGLWVSPSGISFTYRTSTGGATGTKTAHNKTAPYWLMLTRSGNAFSAYYSADGTTWKQLGATQTINMAPNAYLGMGVCSGVTGALCTATLDNVTATP